MILSVVVSRLQKGQWQRIEEEFKFVDYELIVQKDISKALSEVSGRFVLFLEEDSSFFSGQLNNSLDIFRFNQSYRKLAMVTSSVDYDSESEPVGFMYKDGVSLQPIHGDNQYPVSIGYLYGSIIRTTAIKKAVMSSRKDTLYKSVQLSDYFWSNGLRIEMNPKSIYYAPPDAKPEFKSYKIKKSSESLKVWRREFIV
jgi:hypothetical protein